MVQNNINGSFRNGLILIGRRKGIHFGCPLFLLAMNERKRENQRTMLIAFCALIVIVLIGCISPLLLGWILIIGFYSLK